MAEDSGQTVLPALPEHILPLVEGLIERLETGIDVLDVVGCGSGRALNLMARTFPNSRFSGYNPFEEAIARARAEAEEHHTNNLRFEIRDAAALDEKVRYDLIATFDAVHDQADLAAVLKGISTALRDDGVYLMQDITGSSHHNNFDHPIGPFLYTASTILHDGLAGSGRQGTRRHVGRGEGQRTSHGGRFAKVRVEQLPHDFQNYYYIATKG